MRLGVIEKFNLGEDFELVSNEVRLQSISVQECRLPVYFWSWCVFVHGGIDDGDGASPFFFLLVSSAPRW